MLAQRRGITLVSICLLLIAGLYLAWPERSATVVTPLEVPAPMPEALPEVKTGTLAPVIERGTPAPPQTPHTVSVRGWIGNALGEGIAGIQLRLEPKMPGEIQIYRAVTSANGEFRFDAVSRGKVYRLTAEASNRYAGALIDPFTITKPMARTTIILDAIDLVYADGMIVDTEFAPVGGLTIQVKSLEYDFPRQSITSDASGYFRLDGFPAGRIELSASGGEYFKIYGIELDKSEYRNLLLAIDKGSYHLSGWVSDANGVPVENAMVVVNSVFERQGYFSRSYRNAQTDAYGAFAFAGLGGIEHRIGIYAAGFDAKVIKHRFASHSDRLEIRLERPPENP